MIQASDRRDLVDPLLTDDALTEQLVAALPPPVRKTDADGRFTVRAGPGDWLIAHDQRTIFGGTNEKYLWVEHLSADNSPLLVSNDSLVQTSALAAFLGERSGVSMVQQQVKVPDVSTETEAWIKTAKEKAVSARTRAIADELDGAKARYKRTLESAKPNLLGKWGGESWRKLQVDVASIDASQDPLRAAAHYREASASLDLIIGDAIGREAAFQEQMRVKQAEEQEAAMMEQQRAADVAQAKAEAAERKALADKLAGQEAERMAVEKAKKDGELEKLRNTPLYEGDTSIITSQFMAFEFGFGFRAKSEVSGAKLEIYRNGKQPSILFGGDEPDAVINMDSRRKGSEQYESGGHHFLIEWNKPTQLSWSPRIILRRID